MEVNDANPGLFNSEVVEVLQRKYNMNVRREYVGIILRKHGKQIPSSEKKNIRNRSSGDMVERALENYNDEAKVEVCWRSYEPHNLVHIGPM